MTPPDPAGLRSAVDSAANLFLRKGYAATSLQDIADDAGVSKSLLHYHFSSKRALARAVVDPFLDASETALHDLEATTDPPPQDILARWVELLLTHRRVVRLLDTDVTVAAEPALAARVRTGRVRWRALLADDRVRAAAAMGAVTRPATALDDVPDDQLRDRLVDVVPVALAVLES